MCACVCVTGCSDNNCDICDASTCYACQAGYVKDVNGICQGGLAALSLISFDLVAS